MKKTVKDIALLEAQLAAASPSEVAPLLAALLAAKRESDEELQKKQKE